MQNEIEKTTEAHVQAADPQLLPGAYYFQFDGCYTLRIKEVREKGFMMEKKRSDGYSDYGEKTLSGLKECAFAGYSEEDVETYLQRGAEMLETGQGLEMIAAIQEEQEEPTMALMQQGDRIFSLEKKALVMMEKITSVRKQMESAMAIKRAQMAAIIGEANAAISAAMEMVSKVQKIIRSLELYAGVNEDLVLVQEGEPAPPETPFVLRQAVVFMDEEVGVWRQGGFDYTDVTKFDEWLTHSENLMRVAPEQKCMVAFRPRRYDKEYNNPYEKAQKNRWNKETYFLIRNGGNVYRIFTDNLQLGKKMFLSTSEMERLTSPEVESDIIGGGNYKRQRSQSEIDAVRDLFTRQALFIQGLLDRGEILNPVPPGINIFQPDTYQNWLQLVFDAEGVLTDGRLPWREWKQQVNETIQEGSRVILAEGAFSGKYEDIMNEHGKKYYSGSWNCPTPPKSGGLFIAEKGFKKRSYYSSGEWDFSIKYAPGGTYSSWSDYSVERKNRVSFGLDVDMQVLNYDGVSLADVEYYMNDRVNRGDYATMLPLLEKIRVERLAEIEAEKDFVKLIAGRNRVKEGEVWTWVEWWKTKNKWKRPIREDDAKALRMIERKLKKLSGRDSE